MGRTVGEQQKNSILIPDMRAGQLAGNRKIGTIKWRGTAQAVPFFAGDRNTVKNYTKTEAIRILADAAKNYNIHLCNYQFLIAYKCGVEYCFSVVGFQAANFLHLTGLESDLSPKHFYGRLLSKKLSPDDFSFNSHGYDQLKLAVLSQLSSLFYGHTLRGIFNRSGIFIEADYVVGNTAGSFSVCFRNGNRGFDVPVSLYNEDVRKLTTETTKILAVWRRPFGTADFSTNTYCAKDVDPVFLLSRYYDNRS